MTKNISFCGRVPSRLRFKIANKTDHDVEVIHFDIPEIAEDQTAVLNYMLEDGTGDAVALEENEVNVTRDMTAASGVVKGWITIFKGTEKVWNSDIMIMDVGDLPAISEAIEHQYPTAFEQALAEMEDGVAHVEDAIQNIQETVNAALQEAKDSGEFDGPPGPQGEKGEKGDRGPQGIPGGGGGDVADVQVDGVSVVAYGVANIPIASATTDGVVRVDSADGLSIDTATHHLKINAANAEQVKGQSDSCAPIVPENQHGAAFYGLAKAAGDTTQTASANEVGSYTESARSKIHDMIDAPVYVEGTAPVISAKPGMRYVCGEVAAISITPPQAGICDVVFTSGTTATLLTVPNSVKWANGFDPTDLSANTVYEINIMDGILGVAGSWT